MGAALAQRGMKVAILEASDHMPDSLAGRSEQDMILHKAAAPDPIHFNGEQVRPLLGALVGGSTGLYGAALLRPSPSDWDLEPFYGKYQAKELIQWPWPLEDLSAYLEKAEDLFRVAGHHHMTMPFLSSRQSPYTHQAMPLAPFNRDLMDKFNYQGLKPFHMPIAVDSNVCVRCAQCPGFVCPADARASSYNRAIQPQLKQGGLTLLPGHRVLKLDYRGRQITKVELIYKGRIRSIAADAFVLAAGAIYTPYILQSSQIPDPHDLVGRYYMFHLGVVCLSISREVYPGSSTFHKQIALSDFYQGFTDFKHKLGLVQNIPITGPRTIASKSPVPLPPFLSRWLYRHTMATAMVVEDLPVASNRVRWTKRGLDISHRFHPYDLYRGHEAGQRLKKLMKRVLPKSWHVVRMGALENAHLAHQVGTCRMGRDPRYSVVDPMGRHHQLDNLFIADGSVLPTSLGVGPALTIIANALRTADQLRKDA